MWITHAEGNINPSMVVKLHNIHGFFLPQSVCELMWSSCICAVLRGPPAEDGPAASVTAAPAEAGALLAVQRRGPDSAHVHVRPAGPLDGLRLVLHRSQGARKPGLLGYRLVCVRKQLQRRRRALYLIFMLISLFLVSYFYIVKLFFFHFIQCIYLTSIFSLKH